MSVLLAITIDTEPDSWSPTPPPDTLENLKRLPEIARQWQALGLKPTWLATHCVATAPLGVDILNTLAEGGRAEIGAHLHPWTTPPFEEARRPANTMLCNLPRALQAAKLARLLDVLTAATGERPTSFRAGRWGLDQVGVGVLAEAGVAVDSSVTPFISWAHYHGPDHRAAPLQVYRVSERAPITVPDPRGPVVEVPVSCGYNRRPFALAARAEAALGRFKPLRLKGLAWRSGLLRRLLLSPETTSDRDMEIVALALLDEGLPFLQISLHSQSLSPGLSPFAETEADARRLADRVARFVDRLARHHPFKGVTLNELATLAPAEP